MSWGTAWAPRSPSRASPLSGQRTIPTAHRTLNRDSATLPARKELPAIADYRQTAITGGTLHYPDLSRTTLCYSHSIVLRDGNALI